jgi:hypothetical protein
MATTRVAPQLTARRPGCRRAWAACRPLSARSWSPKDARYFRASGGAALRGDDEGVTL